MGNPLLTLRLPQWRLNSLYRISSRLQGRYQRSLANYCFRQPVTLSLSQPIVSFTFDDFPRSALTEGGALLCSYGYLGTYYASFGLMAKVAPTGRIFGIEDLPELVRQGHELGCHTYDHCHSWDTAPSEFEASILRNQLAAAKLVPHMKLRSFSYPISGPRPQTKRRAARYYSSARGGGQTFNIGKTDLNLLAAFFIEQSRQDFDAITKVVDDNVAAKGWLIFATHDISNSPTRFGCTPRLFQQLVEYVADSGAVVLPVSQALERFTSSAAASIAR